MVAALDEGLALYEVPIRRTGNRDRKDRGYIIGCEFFSDCKGPEYCRGFLEYLCIFGNQTKCATWKRKYIEKKEN